MSVERVRTICRALPGVTEDVKWGNDLVFSVGGKMFAVVCLEPPHSVAFKCTDESFAELIERIGITPAPYLARAMWVQETEFGEALDRRELETLLRTAHEVVLSKLPKSRQPEPRAARGDGAPQASGEERGEGPPRLSNGAAPGRQPARRPKRKKCR